MQNNDRNAGTPTPTALAAADPIAREIVIDGAFPKVPEEWSRLYHGVDTMTGANVADLDDDVVLRMAERQDAAYLIGVAVGLRLGRAIHP